MTDREQPQVFFIMLGIAAFGEMWHFETFTLFISLSLSLSPQAQYSTKEGCLSKTGPNNKVHVHTCLQYPPILAPLDLPLHVTSLINAHPCRVGVNVTLFSRTVNLFILNLRKTRLVGLYIQRRSTYTKYYIYCIRSLLCNGCCILCTYKE